VWCPNRGCEVVHLVSRTQKYTPGTRKYLCEQLVCPVDDFLCLLKKQNEPPYKEEISVIQATTIHRTGCLMKDMSKEDEIVMYVGFVDFDAYTPAGTTNFDFKQSLQESFDNGLTFAQVCETHPSIYKCMQAAALLCRRLKTMGFAATCWWTGRKGFRVVWTDLARCFLRCLAGDRRIPLNIANIFLRDYIGNELYETISKLTFFDYIVYTNRGNTAKGIKPDLGPHYSTGLFPFLMNIDYLLNMAEDGQVIISDNICSSGVPYKQMPMNQLQKDEKLCRFIVDWWTHILTNIPEPAKADVLANTKKPPKQTKIHPPHYQRKPPWERQKQQCTARNKLHEHMKLVFKVCFCSRVFHICMWVKSDQYEFIRK